MFLDRHTSQTYKEDMDNSNPLCTDIPFPMSENP